LSIYPEGAAASIYLLILNKRGRYSIQVITNLPRGSGRNYLAVSFEQTAGPVIANFNIDLRNAAATQSKLLLTYPEGAAAAFRKKVS
jgi:hypothetical protein